MIGLGLAGTPVRVPRIQIGHGFVFNLRVRIKFTPSDLELRRIDMFVGYWSRAAGCYL